MKGTYADTYSSIWYLIHVLVIWVQMTIYIYIYTIYIYILWSFTSINNVTDVNLYDSSKISIDAAHKGLLHPHHTPHNNNNNIFKINIIVSRNLSSYFTISVHTLQTSARIFALFSLCAQTSSTTESYCLSKK
ncbi:hypothetical protein YC2023_062677 [Brassica napus]